jgi:hypothetical protein
MCVTKIACLSLVLIALGVSIAFCGDLDDGISKFTDDNITKWDDLGDKDRNVTFIKLNARSQASVRSKNGTAADGSTSGGTNNMNSVVLGAGGTIRGDVIIIDDSSGDKTQIAD